MLRGQNATGCQSLEDNFFPLWTNDSTARSQSLSASCEMMPAIANPEESVTRQIRFLGSKWIRTGASVKAC